MGLGLHCCSSLSRISIPDVDECYFICIDDFSDLVFEPANAVIIPRICFPLMIARKDKCPRTFHRGPDHYSLQIFPLVFNANHYTLSMRARPLVHALVCVRHRPSSLVDDLLHPLSTASLLHLLRRCFLPFSSMMIFDRLSSQM